MKKSRFIAFMALLMTMLLLVCSCGNSASTTPDASSASSETSATETVRTDFESNEEHLSYVLNRVAGSAFGGLGETYDAVLAALKGTGTTLGKVHTKNQISLEVGEELLAMLATNAGLEAEDLKALGSLTGKMEVSMDEGKIQSSMELLLGNQEFTTVDVVTDYSVGKIYFRCPMLSEQYAEVSLDDLGSIGEEMNYSQVLDLLLGRSSTQFSLPDNLPDGEVLNRLMTKYIGLLTAELKNVEKTEETLTAGGVSQKVYKFTVRQDLPFVKNCAKVVLNAAKQDEDIRKIVTDLTDEETYRSFIEKVDEILENIEEDESSDKSGDVGAPLEFYVDEKNNLVGVSLSGILVTSADSGETTKSVEVLNCFHVTDGTKEGFVFSIDVGPFSGGQLLPKVILEGSFEETGKGVNGEIALRMGMEQGDTSLTVAIGKLTVSDLIVTEKTLSGSLTMSFDSGLGQMIPVDGDSASILQMLLGTQIRCTFSSDEKENTGTVEVISDGKKLISLSSSVTVDDQASVTVPSEAVTVEEYVASVDMQKFAERAEQLGLNEKVLEVIKSLISAGEF